MLCTKCDESRNDLLYNLNYTTKKMSCEAGGDKKMTEIYPNIGVFVKKPLSGYSKLV